MTETTPDFSTVVENYAQMILDGMDVKTLEQFAFDTLVDNLTKQYETVDELLEEIKEIYDEEIANDLAGVWFMIIYTTENFESAYSIDDEGHPVIIKLLRK